MVDAFAEAGGNFVDTAEPLHERHQRERYVGELLGGTARASSCWRRSTRCRAAARPQRGGNHRKSLVHSLDASLRRLGTDYIDLYWVHAWDFLTPVEEVMRALDDQVRAGKVLYVGVSDAPAWIVAQANTLAELRGWSRSSAAGRSTASSSARPSATCSPMAQRARPRA